MQTRVTTAATAAVLLLLCLAPTTFAQSTFSFRLGAASILTDAQKGHVGPSVGLAGKFNVVPAMRIRGQFDVDRIQMDDARLRGFSGDQTLTFVTTGFGLELGGGSNLVNVFAHLVPHGTIRTTIRNREDSIGRPYVTSITRFSLGLSTGAGIELYLDDNIGFELIGQFLVYNFDTGPGDPSHRGFRGTAGVQFYIGRNFVRP